MLMLFSWVGLSYTGFKQEMNQVLLWKAGLIFWYFIIRSLYSQAFLWNGADVCALETDFACRYNGNDTVLF